MRDIDRIVLFGPPGVGKSTIAQKLVEFGYHYYEADDDLLPEVVELNSNNKGLTPELRDRQHEVINNHVKELMGKYSKLVVAYDFMWERYREKLRIHCPELRWVYLTTDISKLEKRVDRPDHILTKEFALDIAKRFETPKSGYLQVDNSGSIADAVTKILA